MAVPRIKTSVFRFHPLCLFLLGSFAPGTLVSAAPRVQFNRDVRPCAALVADLRQRGLLDETLVVWAGKLGRTPMAQTNKGSPGRDHHNRGFCIWLAGGGIKRGFSFGATDEFGYAAVENVVSVHDLHATMLHLLGIDHTRFTRKFQGLDARPTGVEKARVVRGILA